MSVPDFQSFMLPLLQFAADGLEHNQRGAKDALSRHFNITESDRREMPPSERQTRFKSGSPLFFDHLVVELLWPWAMAALAKTPVRWARWWTRPCRWKNKGEGLDFG